MCVPPPPPILRWKIHCCGSGCVSDSFDHPHGFFVNFLQVVHLRCIALIRHNTSCHKCQLCSQQPLSPFFFFFFVLRTSARKIVSYSLCLTVEVCIFIIWVHPFFVWCFPHLTRSLWNLISSSDRLKIFLSFTALSYSVTFLSIPSPKPLLKNIG